MPNIQKFLTASLVILFIIIIGEAVYLAVGRQAKPLSQQPSQVTVTPVVKPTLQITKNKIAYQAKNDQEKRTVLYDDPNLPYSGFGEIFAAERNSPRRLFYTVGTLKDWQDIPNSKDKYILLVDPIDKKTLKPQRVIFDSPSSIASPTSFKVENMSTNQIEDLDGKLNITNFAKLSGIVKTQDAIVLLPLVKGQSVAKDNKDTVIVSTLIIRRASTDSL